MPRMMTHLEPLPDHLRDPFECPKTGGITSSLGAFEQNRLELAELRLGQLASSPRATSPSERLCHRLPRIDTND
jgi:hypothetical protein